MFVCFQTHVLDWLGTSVKNWESKHGRNRKKEDCWHWTGWLAEWPGSGYHRCWCSDYLVFCTCFSLEKYEEWKFSFDRWEVILVRCAFGQNRVEWLGRQEQEGFVRWCWSSFLRDRCSWSAGFLHRLDKEVSSRRTGRICVFLLNMFLQKQKIIFVRSLKLKASIIYISGASWCLISLILNESQCLLAQPLLPDWTTFTFSGVTTHLQASSF